MSEGKTEAMPPPEGWHPMMMSMKMMDSYGLKTGPALKDTVESKTFNKDFVLKEIVDMGFYSAFHPFRKQVEKYPLDDIVVVADFEEKYGENWMVCLSEEAYNKYKGDVTAKAEADAKAKREAEAAEEAARLAREAEANRVYEDLPLIPQPYTSASASGTTEEVLRMTARPSRPLLVMKVTRKRSGFGARYTFSDKESDGPVAEFRGRRAPEYTLKRAELDVALQDCPGSLSGHATAATQTTWSRKTNSSAQCDPEPFKEGAKAAPEVALQSFLNVVLPTCEHALEQNETLNIFLDELALLDEDDASVVGSQGQNALHSRINFSDLAYSNNKTLVCLDWHPSNRTWLATSAVEYTHFDTRVAMSGKATTSFVLVYSFAEFSAQVVLEAPADIMCFKWNPWNSNQIAAGCTTGQVLLFDLTDAMSSLSRSKVSKRKGGSRGKDDSETKSDKSIRVKHKFMSTIDFSHTRPVADLHWLPPAHHLTSRHVFQASPDESSYQFMSGAADGQVLVWDTRFVSMGTHRRRGSVSGESSSKSNADVPWSPVYGCLLKAGGQGKAGICRMSLNLETPSDPLICTTEDGLYVVANWAPANQGTGFESVGASAPTQERDDTEDGAGDVGQFRVLWTSPDHSRPTFALERSPFFTDLLLSVGDWCFTLWRGPLKRPLFRSPASSAPITCGRWSPTRPSVIFIGKSDGTVDIWDLVDQSHKPSLTKPIVSLPITCMDFRAPSLAKTQQFLAVGDAKGSLHVLDIPVALRKPGPADHSLMSAYLDRELERVTYFDARRAVRAEELVQKEAAAEAAERAAATAAAALEAELATASATMADGEEMDEATLVRRKAEAKAQQEESSYQALERSIMGELGLDPDTYTVGVDAAEEESKDGGGDSPRRLSTVSVHVDFGATGASAV